MEKENDYQTQVINLNTSTNTKHSNCRVHRPIYFTKLIFKLLLQNLFIRLLKYRLPILKVLWVSLHHNRGRI